MVSPISNLNQEFTSGHNAGHNVDFSSFNLSFNKKFKHVTVPASVAGVLGPIPDISKVNSHTGPPVRLCSNCLSPTHSRPACLNSIRC
jgi:hypothetical protein